MRAGIELDCGNLPHHGKVNIAAANDVTADATTLSGTAEDHLTYKGIAARVGIHSREEGTHEAGIGKAVVDTLIAGGSGRLQFE